jgi:hypothetical protein
MSDANTPKAPNSWPTAASVVKVKVGQKGSKKKK